MSGHTKYGTCRSLRWLVKAYVNRFGYLGHLGRLLRWPIERRCADYRLSYSETLTGLIVRYRTDTISCMRLSPTAQLPTAQECATIVGSMVALYHAIPDNSKIRREGS